MKILLDECMDERLAHDFALRPLACTANDPSSPPLGGFYPRMVRGAYFFMHDFNNPESNHAISRAADEFLRDKPERPIEIPDE